MHLTARSVGLLKRELDPAGMANVAGVQPSGCPWSGSVFEKWFAGSTGDSPVPSGDSPDGTGAAAQANERGLLVASRAAVPVGGSPTGAGGSPAPPGFNTGSKLCRLWVAILVLGGVLWSQAYADLLVSTNSPWRFRKGTSEASSPTNAW